jgi:predicted porin
VADYAFNKHFDVYAGVAYAAVDGGLAAAFPNVPTSGANANIDTTVAMTGLRLKF